jgi:hypothetical protein
MIKEIIEWFNNTSLFFCLGIIGVAVLVKLFMKY